MNPMEKEEALLELVNHYGLPVLLEVVDQIVDRISKETMSVPISSDPEKASMVLYATRMKAEGAQALRNALQTKIQALKSKARENKHG